MQNESDFTFSDGISFCINSISKTRQSIFSAQLKDRIQFHVIQCNIDITKGQGTVKIRSLQGGSSIHFTITGVRYIVRYIEDVVI